MKLKLTKLLMVVILSSLLPSCGTLRVKENADEIQVEYLSKGQMATFNSICFDPETAKVLLKEAYRE